MPKIPKSIMRQWMQMRGNAKWDMFVRTCQWGWPLLLALFTWLICWFKRASMWQVWIGISLVCIISYIFVFWLSRRQKPKSDESKKQNNIQLQPKYEPELAMEIIHPIERDVLTSRHAYRIKIKNRDNKKYIKNLKVVIAEIKWPKSVEKPLGWSGLIFPHQLPEKGNQNNSNLYELAGDTEKEFDLMFVEFHEFTTRAINLAPFKPKIPGHAGIYQSVVSDTRFDVERCQRAVKTSQG
jgi:hypothetical protein